ncbi:hypothetical protein TUM18999_60970 [Pseudomonas tohonis]|uniref:DUF3301 domain-containing protein n=1 Tax=Pseudomonas tohonis TaxID=2725477 RepID=A0A6J4EF37_9PSED|nr:MULTISPECIES: DUF3301 domain-containing protein [Pseudomonas]MDW3713240.1 DUF3301 domain-containing protein [Pseudomonas sp. 2023EL-01195]PZE15505.1 DUF3301 domain-containing protein [Pseudomonas sp. 57B-090624]BBP86309.1 hypothetical protein PHLH8_59510 [Pseudomonas sp. Pc102]BCG27906.1 hypothetical protein TUM18999_60970 [Pseudomonas tohonis]GJN52509.1 hypothetical protein TUM20286_22610 [Pseudomonas tohonis]
MISLGDVFLFLLFAAGAAWLWRGHGIRERALALVKQYCTRFDVELLDGNVALQRLAIVRDARGHRRLARIYGFEFTVTGEQRLTGTIQMFGNHGGRIELDAHPFQPPVASEGNVIQISDWRRSHPRPDEQRHVE